MLESIQTSLNNSNNTTLWH